MELDEILYSYFVKLVKKKKQKSFAKKTHVVLLDTIKSKLTIISSALTGTGIEIHPAEKEGGYKNKFFFLPSQIEFFPRAEDNFLFFLFRTVFLSIQFQKGLNFEKDQNQTLEISRQSALDNAPLVLKNLEEEYPSVFITYEKLLEEFASIYPDDFNEKLFWFYGKWMINTADVDTGNHLSRFGNQIKTAVAEEIKTVLKAKAVEEIKTVEVDKKAQEDFVLNHSFEKVETADEFDGGWRDFDGEDQLEDHADALEELQMKYAVRTDSQTHSIYQTDFLENTNISESAKITTSKKALLYAKSSV